MYIYGVTLKSYDPTNKEIRISEEEAENLRIILQNWKLQQIVSPIIEQYDFTFDCGNCKKEELLDAFTHSFIDSLSDIAELDGFEQEIENRLEDFVEDNGSEFGIVLEG